MSLNNVIPANLIDKSWSRTTDWVKELKSNEVFVFGDNEAHIHGAGAAKQAMRFGAKHGQQISEQTYGIPTKDVKIKYALSLNKIKKHVNRFIEYAKQHPNKIFLVTAIGTGLAGLNEKDIAIMFKEAVDIKNIHLPHSFWKILLYDNK